MSEAGHAILRKRANKLKHRKDRPMRRAHRSDSFDDDADPHGSILQHPTDKWSSDEDDSEEEKEKEYQERMARLREQRVKTLAAQQAAAEANLSVPELHQLYQKRLRSVNDETQDLERKIKKDEMRIKQLNQWKNNTMRTKDFNPYELLHYNAVELAEPTKVRFYDMMISKAVGRSFLRTFRLRKMLRHVHECMSDIVKQYMHGKSGLLRTEEAEAAREAQRIVEEQRQATRETPESYYFQPGQNSFNHQPHIPAHLAPRVSELTGLPLKMPPFSLAAPTLLGSLTDDSVSGQPLTILTSAVTLPSSNDKKITLQPEIQTWYAQSQAILQSDQWRRLGGASPHPHTRRIEDTAAATSPLIPDEDSPAHSEPNSHASSHSDLFEKKLRAFAATSIPDLAQTHQAATARHHQRARENQQQNNSTGSGLQDLMYCLADCGPILRCIVEDLLNGYGESHNTAVSFSSRTRELQQQVEETTASLAHLQDDENKLRAYLELNLEAMLNLLNEQQKVDSFLAAHGKYEAKLRKTFHLLTLQRERREMESRKLKRVETLLAQGKSATGGLGISSTLLAAAKKEREAQEEAERLKLLEEIMAQQELALQSVSSSAAAAHEAALKENNPHLFAVGAKKPVAEDGTTAEEDAVPPGLSELISLFEAYTINTPHLASFLERKKKELTKALEKRGFSGVDLANHGAMDSHSRSNSISPVRSPIATTAVAGATPGSSAASHVRTISQMSYSSIASQKSDAPRGVGILQTTVRRKEKPAPVVAAPPARALPMEKPFKPQPALSTLAEKLQFHNGLDGPHPDPSKMSFSPSPPPMHVTPFAALPAPTTAKPIQLQVTKPTLILPPSKEEQHLYVPTQLIGGLTLQAREKEMAKLKNSPYMVSSIMTPAQELAAIDASHATSATAKPSARGSRPLKSALKSSQPSGVKLPIGGASTIITRQKLAQKKMLLEKQIFEASLFDGQNY